MDILGREGEIDMGYSRVYAGRSKAKESEQLASVSDGGRKVGREQIHSPRLHDRLKFSWFRRYTEPTVMCFYQSVHRAGTPRRGAFGKRGVGSYRNG